MHCAVLAKKIHFEFPAQVRLKWKLALIRGALISEIIDLTFGIDFSKGIHTKETPTFLLLLIDDYPARVVNSSRGNRVPSSMTRHTTLYRGTSTTQANGGLSSTHHVLLYIQKLFFSTSFVFSPIVDFFFHLLRSPFGCRRSFGMRIEIYSSRPFSSQTYLKYTRPVAADSIILVWRNSRWRVPADFVSTISDRLMGEKERKEN